MRTRALMGTVALAVTISAAVWAADTTKRLRVDGSVVSSDVRTIEGRAYVPLADVAKAFRRTVVATKDGYDLAEAGGANQVGDYSGKVGDVIFTGRWRFTVTGVEEKDAYTQEYDGHKAKIEPKGDDFVLVVVRCRLKNATKEIQSVYLIGMVPGYQTLPYGRTSLTDQTEHGYTLYTHDAQTDEGVTSKILPGAAQEFALIFNVPRNMKRKDLIFSITTPAGPDKNGTDVRVSLK